MRSIGHIEGEAAARKFGDYLSVQGIENQLEADAGGVWTVWILADEELERARTLLAEFQGNPGDAKFQGITQIARELRDRKQKEQAAYENRVKERRNLFRPVTGYGIGPLTFALICLSTVVFFLSKYGDDMKAVAALYISEGPRNVSGFELLRAYGFKYFLPEVQHGEVWRLFTPALMHGGFMHILFNMLWLRDLGSMIEARQGSGLLAVMVLVIAAGSDLAQYFISGPNFVGMSGVVYGLMGYIWIRGKFDPGSGLFLHPTTVTMMIIWFFLCMTGILGPIANFVHAAGLGLGMGWGYLSSLRRR